MVFPKRLDFGGDTMDSKVIYDVVAKLVGPVRPCGDSAIDSIRKENLEKLIAVTEMLVGAITVIAEDKDSSLHSIRECGELAQRFLEAYDGNA